MSLKKILNIASFALLFYLLAESFLHFDFAVTKNNALISMKKAEIDSTQSLDAVKIKAREYLDTIRKTRQQYSTKSVIRFWLLAAVVFCQILLLTMNRNTTGKAIQ